MQPNLTYTLETRALNAKASKLKMSYGPEGP